jgi:hypothetical protein
MLLAICTLLLISALVSPVENYAQLRYMCLTPDLTVLDYCSMDLTGPNPPLKTTTPQDPLQLYLSRDRHSDRHLPALWLLQQPGRLQRVREPRELWLPA